MARQATIKVVGARRLRATMKAAGADMQQMSEAHQQVGQIVISAAAPLTPRQTGRLAGSLKASRTRASAIVRSNVVYAGVQEYGWPAHGIEPSAMVRTGAAKSQPVWLTAYRAAIDRALKQVKGA